MRAAFLLVLVGLIATVPRAEAISLCNNVPGRLWEWVANYIRGAPPRPVRPVPIPPRGDLKPGERPTKPDSDFHEVVEIRQDPQYPDHFVYVVSPKVGSDRANARLESSRAFEQFVRRFPEFAGARGIRVEDKGGRVQIIYPTIEGLNARAREGDVKFWRDRGGGDTDHIVMARVLAERGEIAISEGARMEPIDKSNRDYHFHDMFVHAIGFAVIPPKILKVTRARLKGLLAVYDLPALAGNEAARKRLEHLIVEEISQLDSTTNLLQGDLAALKAKPGAGFDSDAFNLLLKLGPLAYGKTHVETKVWQGLDGVRLSSGQRAAIEAALRDMPPTERINVETEADAMAAYFRGMMRN